MLALACPNYYEPEEIAETITGICDEYAPARGYTMTEHDGRKRLEVIAEMVDALRDDIPPAVRMQLTHIETFTAVSEVLEWDNNHTENIAFALAFGDSSAVLDALLTVHYCGQSYAIGRRAQRPETAR